MNPLWSQKIGVFIALHLVGLCLSHTIMPLREGIVVDSVGGNDFRLRKWA